MYIHFETIRDLDILIDALDEKINKSKEIYASYTAYFGGDNKMPYTRIMWLHDYLIAEKQNKTNERNVELERETRMFEKKCDECERTNIDKSYVSGKQVCSKCRHKIEKCERCKETGHTKYWTGWKSYKFTLIACENCMTKSEKNNCRELG